MFAVAVSGQRAKKLVANGAMLVDLRSPVAFRDKSIPGAVNLALRNISSLQRHPKSTKVVLIGDPSDPTIMASAENYLAGYGFAELYKIRSIDDWPA